MPREMSHRAAGSPPAVKPMFETLSVAMGPNPVALVQVKPPSTQGPSASAAVVSS